MWIGRHSAAGQPPSPERMERWRRRMSPPDNEFPAGLGLTVLLGHTEDVAVGITQVDAFSTGFRFTLAVRVRRARAELAHGGLFTLISAHARPGVEIPLERRLLLGIEYPDDRRASTLYDMPTPGAVAGLDDAQLVLVQQSGSGDEQSVDQTYWVAPLPPEGPVTAVLAWPGFGIPECRTVLDGGAIRAAAARSQVLWSPQPRKDSSQPPPPPRPSTGWFAYPPD